MSDEVWTQEELDSAKERAKELNKLFNPPWWKKAIEEKAWTEAEHNPSLRDFGFTSIGVDFYLRGAQALADLLGEGKDAEAAADKYCETLEYQDCLPLDVANGFLAGAQWQAAKDAADRETFLAEHDENVRLHTELEAARAEIAELNKYVVPTYEQAIANRDIEIRDYRSRIASLEAALEFIAHPRDCPACSIDDPGHEVPCYCEEWNPVYIAREALALAAELLGNEEQ